VPSASETGFVVQLRFDGESDARLRGWWSALAAAGLPSFIGYSHERHVPHLALAGIVAPPDDSALRRLARLKSVLPKALSFNYLGADTSSPSELFVGLAVDRALLSCHGEVQQVLKLDHQLPGFALGEWVPRCVLSDRLEDADALGRALSVVATDFAPFQATISSGCFFDRETGMEFPIF
jgi:hypothetical protein